MQDNGLVPIVEPEILLDGDHPIERTLEVAERVWAEVFYYLTENNVMFEGILLKPSMVTPGAEHKQKASPETIATYTLTMLNRRVPPAVPGIMVQMPEPIPDKFTCLVTFHFDFDTLQVKDLKRVHILSSTE